VAKPDGAKPSIDYVVTTRSPPDIKLAVESKWAGSSHCTPENVLWDLVRLKLLKDQNPAACCGLLIAGHKNATEKLFSKDLFTFGTQHPLHRIMTRRKIFSFKNNRDHQVKISKAMATWLGKYPKFRLPDLAGK
jgi:hypothetical protein